MEDVYLIIKELYTIKYVVSNSFGYKAAVGSGGVTLHG